MQTSSAQHPLPATDVAALQIHLLAMNLAIELARAGRGERTFAVSAQAVKELCDLLADDTRQLGGGEGLTRAVEELERVLREAGEAGFGILAARTASGDKNDQG